MLEKAYSPIEFGKKTVQFPTGMNVNFDIVGGNQFGRYPKISSAQTFNMMISDGFLVNFPGYKTKKMISPAQQGRGAYASQRFNHIIVVLDSNVFTVSQSFTADLIGSLNTTSGAVTIAENLAGEIAICDGQNIYIFNYLTGGFLSPTIDFLPGYIAFQDTYFIASDRRTNQWRLSDNNNGLSWPPDAAHVGTIQSKPTNTVACIPLDKQLFIMGSNVTEPWYDVGYTLFPYQRTNYFNIDYGTASPSTIDAAFGMMVFLGSNERTGISLMLSMGGKAQRISNDGLDAVFNRLTNPSDSVGFLYRIDGHIFYHLTFVTDNLTYVYDFTTKQFYSLTDKDMNHHIARKVVFFNGKYYFISFNDGNLYELDSSIYDLDGHEMPRFRILSNIRIPSGDLFVVRNINITLEQGISPTLQRVDISLSNDGGYSYQNVYSEKLNPYGERPNVLNFWDLGSSNDMTIKFAFWGNDRFVVGSAAGNFYQ